MIACSKSTRIISMNGGFVSNAMCDTCTTIVTDEDGLKEKLESALSRTKLQEYKVTEENGELTIYAKGIPAHASTPHLGVNACRSNLLNVWQKQALKMTLWNSITPISALHVTAPALV